MIFRINFMALHYFFLAFRTDHFLLFRYIFVYKIWIIFITDLPLPSKKNDMANHKATKKDMRQATKRRERNKYNGKTTRNAIRDLKNLTEKKAAGEKLPTVESMIDKLAKRGIIHKNKAAHLKSKLAKRVTALA